MIRAKPIGRLYPLIAGIAIGINPPDLLVELHVLEGAIPALRAAFQVTTASLVQCHPVAFAAKCLIHNIATEKSKVVIVADRTHTRDWLAIQLAHKKALWIGFDEQFGIMKSWIPPSSFHPLDGYRIDIRNVHLADDVAATGKIFRGL